MICGRKPPRFGLTTGRQAGYEGVGSSKPMAVNEQLVAYRVWDAPTRSFHWINALSVLGLILVGILILFSDNLGISAAGRVTLKTIHVWLGYVMTVNLLWRFVWAFLGNRYARWRAMHVIAVIVTELREGGSLISAMFTGRKIFPGPPEDL
jgi:cytochrome b